MGDKSAIEWTDATWNPITGCTRVSAGCDNCYAVTMTKRLAAMGRSQYQGLINDGKDHFNGTIKLHPDRFDQPLRWKKPRRIFVCSMSDLFHESVPEHTIYTLFKVMERAHWHQFQILTKRPHRVFQVWDLLRWPDNVWFGTTVENDFALHRIKWLIKVPAKIRFVSFEPLIGPITTLTPDTWSKIHWAIVGGESGAKARPMHPEWARKIRDQCAEAGVPFFFKQWGNWTPEKPDDFIRLSKHRYSHETKAMFDDGSVYNVTQPDTWGGCTMLYLVGKKKAGRLLEDREWNELPT